MCRIFGFRSILQSGVHKSLIDSDNAIIQQSDRHPDGWGVAYYHMGSPHLIKNENQARECKIFEKVSGVVSSQTVITHIRKSTVGAVGPLNTHPFQFGPWVFAHNGNLQGFQEQKADLVQMIDPTLRKYILGETDSETLFYLLLTVLKEEGVLEGERESVPFKTILKEWVSRVESLFGVLTESQGDYDKNYLTCLLSNGKNLFAFQGGQQLYFSTHKKQCSERETCSYFAPLCEKEARTDDKVHHLLVSSEIIKNENHWTPLRFGEFVGVDQNFIFQKDSLSV